MLTIEFSGCPKAYAIIVDEPVNGVSGVVECSVCDLRMVLTTLDTKEISDEIEEFIKNHKCLPLARVEEVLTFAEKLKKGMPTAHICVKRGQKIIKDF